MPYEVFAKGPKFRQGKEFNIQKVMQLGLTITKKVVKTDDVRMYKILVKQYFSLDFVLRRTSSAENFFINNFVSQNSFVF